MMRDESARSVLEAVTSNPKVATAVAAGTASLGAASQLDLIKGWLSLGSMAVGILTGVVVLFIQLIRLEQAIATRKQDELKRREKVQADDTARIYRQAEERSAGMPQEAWDSGELHTGPRGTGIGVGEVATSE